MQHPSPRPRPAAAPTRRGAAAALALALWCGAAACPAQTAPLRAPDIHYDPTPPNVVAAMMRLAEVRAGDVVYDLGCGDGRTVIAALQAGASRAVCVDIDPQRIRESRANAAAAGVADRIRFVEADLFTTDFGDATVIIVFLWPDLNLKLRPRLWREARPGTRVISYVHDMGDWRPHRTQRVTGAHGERNLYLWVIGAPAPG
ncbi:MAG: methyltransferase domain-containing protein [Burkholderiales bacterium]|nr:methyltransferase domain-containing protein [Burkholderiales bacterium]